MFVLVLLATVVVGFLLKWLALSISLFSLATAKQYSIMFSMSFLCVWGLKFTVVLLCTIFSGITKGHKRYNAENYEEMLSVTRAVSPGLVIVAKTIISLGGFLMFSGLWLK
ncbi:hypothetical protein R4Q63_001888 [Enterobacter cloacae]